MKNREGTRGVWLSAICLVVIFLSAKLIYKDLYLTEFDYAVCNRVLVGPDFGAAHFDHPANWAFKRHMEQLIGNAAFLKVLLLALIAQIPFLFAIERLETRQTFYPIVIAALGLIVVLLYFSSFENFGGWHDCDHKGTWEGIWTFIGLPMMSFLALILSYMLMAVFGLFEH